MAVESQNPDFFSVLSRRNLASTDNLPSSRQQIDPVYRMHRGGHNHVNCTGHPLGLAVVLVLDTRKPANTAHVFKSEMVNDGPEQISDGQGCKHNGSGNILLVFDHCSRGNSIQTTQFGSNKRALQSVAQIVYCSYHWGVRSNVKQTKAKVTLLLQKQYYTINYRLYTVVLSIERF